MVRAAIQGGLGLILVAGAVTASAQQANTDFGISDEAGYQTFRGALIEAEYVRYDFALAPNTRIVGATTALMVFATQNPLADESLLASFLDAYDADLRNATTDPDLRRPEDFLNAVRFTQTSLPELAGTDTRVGEGVLDALEVSIRPVDGFSALRRRMVDFDTARARSFSNSSAWTSVLVLGLSGRDLEGAPNAGIRPVLLNYLVQEGFEPVPDGIDDGRFDGLGTVFASLPSSYIAFDATRNAPVETTDAWGAICGGFGVVRATNEAVLDDLAIALDNEPTLVEGAMNAGDSVLIDQIAQSYADRLTEVAAPRATFATNTLLLMQHADPSVRELATAARDLGNAQLETNDTLAAIETGVLVVGGIGQIVAGAASNSPADVVTGVMDIAFGALGVADLLGAGGPSTEEQIFDEIGEVRAQLDDMQMQMHDRFNRIEDQLNEVYVSIATGFNSIEVELQTIQGDVDAIRSDMIVARASLERIEDALWGVADDILLTDLTLLTNELLDYRNDSAVDLNYSESTPNFVSGTSDLFTWATSVSYNTTFAGDQASTVDFSNFADRIDGTLGRNVNDLRTFPTTIGFAALHPTRVPAPAAWTQSGASYAQLIRENPWYFALMYRQQLATEIADGTPTEIDQVIAGGEALASMVNAGRNEPFFCDLTDAFLTITTLIQTRVDSIVIAATDEWQTRIDPWAGLEQSFLPTPPMTEPRIQRGSNNVSALNLDGDTGAWGVFGPFARVSWEVLNRFEAQSNNGIIAEFTWDAVAPFEPDIPNDAIFSFTISVLRDVPGGTDVVLGRGTRTLAIEFFAGVDAQSINSDSNAGMLLDEDLPLWRNIRGQLGADTDLTSESMFGIDGFGRQVEFRVISDSYADGAPGLTAAANAALETLHDEIWTNASTDPIIADIDQDLETYEAIIDAYVSLSVPELLESSSIANAALRGDPSAGGLALRPAVPFADQMGAFIGQTDEPRFLLGDDYSTRMEIFKADLMDALDARPTAGHGYSDWVLNELVEARDNALRLAIDDLYQTDGPLVVDAAAGLLANDVQQMFRSPEIDPAHAGSGSDIAPANGMVVIGADGSFTYTPDPGFVGTDTFTYATRAEVLPGVFAHSDPATVRIEVTEGTGCPCEANGAGPVDILDLLVFLEGFLSGEAAADFNGDNDISIVDLLEFLACWFPASTTGVCE